MVEPKKYTVVLTDNRPGHNTRETAIVQKYTNKNKYYDKTEERDLYMSCDKDVTKCDVLNQI